MIDRSLPLLLYMRNPCANVPARSAGADLCAMTCSLYAVALHWSAVRSGFSGSPNRVVPPPKLTAASIDAPAAPSFPTTGWIIAVLSHLISRFAAISKPTTFPASFCYCVLVY